MTRYPSSATPRRALSTFHRLAAAAGLAAALAAAPAHAGPFDAEYVFGDSLSDNGNLAEALHTNFPNPPSFHDSFTNGPVAASILASKLGFTLTPSLWLTGFHDTFNLFGGASFVPGTNYAVAGATSAAAAQGGPAGINLPQQLAAYSAISAAHADPNALYVVMIGGNDVRNAALQNTGAAAVQAGVTAEITAIQTLLAEGAKNIFVVNVPNVGLIPEFAQDAPALAGAATSFSELYDASLAAALMGLPTSGADVSLFDLFTFNDDILANAAALGFTDTTDRCFTNTPLAATTSPQCGPNAQNINQFLYWDSIHPTAPVQALWGNAFASALGVPLPEPSDIALLAIGVAGLVIARRRRTR
jgi:outer membrane lipase/esterase